jgi:hypothetical protein
MKKFTFEWIYFFWKTLDILFITFLLTPLLVYTWIKTYKLFFKCNLLKKVLFPIFFMANIFNYLYTFIFVFIFKMRNNYLIFKKNINSKIFEDFNVINKNYAENKFYEIFKI